MMLLSQITEKAVKSITNNSFPDKEKQVQQISFDCQPATVISSHSTKRVCSASRQTDYMLLENELEQYKNQKCDNDAFRQHI